MPRILLALVAVLTSCAPAADYVRADADTYTRLAPFAEAGIAASDEPADQKERLVRLLRSWELRVRLAGGFEPR